MGLIVTLTAALALWITAWTLGIKAFDAFMAVVAVMVLAVAVRLLTPFVKEQLGR